jgi:hypothetical protein
VKSEVQTKLLLQQPLKLIASSLSPSGMLYIRQFKLTQSGKGQPRRVPTVVAQEIIAWGEEGKDTSLKAAVPLQTRDDEALVKNRRRAGKSLTAW